MGSSGPPEDILNTFRNKNKSIQGGKPVKKKVNTISRLFAAELKKNNQTLSVNSLDDDGKKLDNIDLNAYNDVSTDEEALEEAIREEAIRMQPKAKRLSGLEIHQRNQLMATVSESDPV